MTARQWQANYAEVLTRSNLPEWHDQAACRNHPNPDLWFPERGGTTKPAKTICKAECPVQPSCLDWALEERPLGIWGGTSERERRALRRR